MINRTQKRWRIAILIIGISSLIFSIFFPYMVRKYLKHDYENAPLQTGMATVVLMVGTRKDLDGKTYDPKILVRFENAVHRVRRTSDADIAGLKENETAEIEYRKGKTGRIYVETISPTTNHHIP